MRPKALDNRDARVKAISTKFQPSIMTVNHRWKQKKKVSQAFCPIMQHYVLLCQSAVLLLNHTLRDYHLNFDSNEITKRIYFLP